MMFLDIGIINLYVPVAAVPRNAGQTGVYISRPTYVRRGVPGGGGEGGLGPTV